jgi:hypothetical protein
LILDGWLGNDTGSVIYDILVDVLLKFCPIKMFLNNGHSFLYTKMYCHLPVVGFPSPLFMLFCGNIDMAKVA